MSKLFKLLDQLYFRFLTVNCGNYRLVVHYEAFIFLSLVLKMGGLKAVQALMPFNFGRIMCC